MIKIHYGQSPLLFINFIILFYSLGVYMMMKTPEISKSYTHLFCLIILTYSPCLNAGDSWIQTILAY